MIFRARACGGPEPLLPFLVCFLSAVAFMVVGAPSAEAEIHRPQVKNKASVLPPRSSYRVHVFGDSLARGLWHGMHNHFRRDRSITIERRAKSATGLVRDDRYDWQSRIESYAREDFEIAVVLIGGNDRQDIWDEGTRVERFTPAWKAAYARRIDAFTRALIAQGKTVYWIGLPVVRSGRMTRDYAMMNSIYRERASLNGANFIDMWHAFRGSDGGYTAYGPDIRGRTRKLRDDDGLHFSAAGNLLFASEIAPYLERDIAAARQHRLNAGSRSSD